MNGEITSFLREGVFLYAEARATLALFEREIGKLLDSVLHDRRRWEPLKAHQVGKPVPEKGGYGYSVCSYITGHLPRHGEVEIDCGFWASPPEIEQPVIYARFYKKPGRRTFSWEPRGRSGILSFDWSGKTVLYLPVPKSVEIEAPLNKLLDALLAQLT